MLLFVSGNKLLRGCSESWKSRFEVITLIIKKLIFSYPSSYILKQFHSVLFRFDLAELHMKLGNFEKAERMLKQTLLKNESSMYFCSYLWSKEDLFNVAEN